MSAIIALSLKLGIGALPAIFLDLGLFAALFAFFAFMPLGHMTIGSLMVVMGVFYPKMPADDTKHVFKVGSKLEVNGSARTALIGVGALVLVGSFAEAALSVTAR